MLRPRAAISATCDVAREQSRDPFRPDRDHRSCRCPQSKNEQARTHPRGAARQRPVAGADRTADERRQRRADAERQRHHEELEPGRDPESRDRDGAVVRDLRGDENGREIAEDRHDGGDQPDAQDAAEQIRSADADAGCGTKPAPPRQTMTTHDERRASHRHRIGKAGSRKPRPAGSISARRAAAGRSRRRRARTPPARAGRRRAAPRRAYWRSRPAWRRNRTDTSRRRRRPSPPPARQPACRIGCGKPASNTMNTKLPASEINSPWATRADASSCGRRRAPARSPRRRRRRSRRPTSASAAARTA